MIYLNTFLYYTLFSSVIVIYGIGLNRSVEIGISLFYKPVFYLKALFTIISSSVLSWLFTNYILMPLKLVELFPLISLLIFICISTFIEALVRLTCGFSVSEFIVSFLIILLSIFESTSILFSILICASSFISILFLIPFCISFKKRITANGNQLDEKYYSLFLIFLAILILLLTVFDINWLKPGVLK